MMPDIDDLPASGGNNDTPMTETPGNNPPGVSDSPKAPETTAPEKEPAEKEKEEAPAADIQKEEVDYSDLSLPEGFELNTELMEELTPQLKDLGADKKQAEAIVGLGAKLIDNYQAEQISGWQKQVDTWVKETKNDPEIGSDEALAVACRAVKQFGGEELTEVFDKYGIGNHPAVVRFCYRIGQAISEDKAIPGSSGTSNADKTFGEILYANK